MIANLIWLTGTDDFHLSARKRAYLKGFRQKYPNGEIHFFGAEDFLHELENAIFTPSLFGEKRMAVCENFWSADVFAAAEKNNFFQKLPDFADYSVLILIDSAPDRRLKMNQFLEKNAKREKFDPKSEFEIRDWICQRVESRDRKISTQNARFLLERCGGNLWNLDSEIAKLSTFCDAEITEKSIRELTMPHPEAVIWGFLDEVSAGKTSAALKSLQTLLACDHSPHQILAMIMRQVGIFAQVFAAVQKKMPPKEVAQKCKMAPFVAQKMCSNINRFPAPKIQKLFDSLFALDRDLKNSTISITAADSSELVLRLERFVLEVGE